MEKLILTLQQPVLGNCLEMQLLCNHSAEVDTHFLGIFNTEVKLFNPPPPSGFSEGERTKFTGRGPKIPQIGWNNIYHCKSVLFNGIKEDPFVNTGYSYFADLCAEIGAKTDYILPYSAALQKNNFYAVQFHPEKSGTVGETILKNFIEIA